MVCEFKGIFLSSPLESTIKLPVTLPVALTSPPVFQLPPVTLPEADTEVGLIVPVIAPVTDKLPAVMLPVILIKLVP